jgi:hypothetical protein
VEKPDDDLAQAFADLGPPPPRAANLAAALACAALGWHVFPCGPDKQPLTRHGFKDASTDPAAVRILWAKCPQASVGVATGASGLVVVDLDCKNGQPGLDEWHKIVSASQEPLEETTLVETPSGGLHVYYRANGHRVTSSAGRLAPGIDTRAEGGYVIAGGSPGYLYVDDHGPECLASLPPGLGEKLAYAMAKPADEKPAGQIPEGRRDATLTSLAGTMRRRGLSADAIYAALAAENKASCKPPLPDAQVRKIAGSVGRYEPARPVQEPDVPMAPADGESGKRCAIYVCLGNVPARPVDYEWHRRLVRGGVNLIVGDPGMGKGFVELDIASRVTRGGDWPDNSGKATGGAVILLTAEDALAETVRPRVDRMGGDPSRIFVLEAVHTDTGNKSFNLADDLPALEEMVRETGAVMVEIDPLHAYLSAHVDSHRGSDVRGQIMAPLQALADRTHVTILLIHHLNKNAENLSSLYRASGSLDFVAAARSVMGVTFDPEDAEEDENLRRRILVTMKFNLDLLPPALGYHLTDGRVAWDAEPVKIDRRQMFRGSKAQRKPSDRAERALAFANQYLIDGGWHETTPMVEKAAAVGVDRDAVYDAMHALSAESKRQGFPAVGLWRLPPRQEEGDNPDGFPF